MVGPQIENDSFGELERKTWSTHPADEKGYEALSSPENTRHPVEINKNQNLENEPGHVCIFLGY